MLELTSRLGRGKVSAIFVPRNRRLGRMPKVEVTFAKPLTEKKVREIGEENRFSPYGSHPGRISLRSSNFTILFNRTNGKKLTLQHHTQKGVLSPRERERLSNFVTNLAA